MQVAQQLPRGAMHCVRGQITPKRNGHVPSPFEIEMLLRADDSKESSNLKPTSHFNVGQRVVMTSNIATALGATRAAKSVPCCRSSRRRRST